MSSNYPISPKQYGGDEALYGAPPITTGLGQPYLGEQYRNDNAYIYSGPVVPPTPRSYASNVVATALGYLTPYRVPKKYVSRVIATIVAYIPSIYAGLKTGNQISQKLFGGEALFTPKLSYKFVNYNKSAVASNFMISSKINKTSSFFRKLSIIQINVSKSVRLRPSFNQISQALFGGEKLFSSILATSRIVSRSVYTTNTFTNKVNKSSNFLRKLSVLQTNLSKGIRYRIGNQISQALFGGEQLFSSILPTGRKLYKSIYITSVSSTKVNKSSNFLRKLSIIQVNSSSFIRILPFRIGNQISQALFGGETLFSPKLPTGRKLYRSIYITSIQSSKTTKVKTVIKYSTVVQTNFANGIKRIIFPGPGNQISQALFGGEKLFPAIVSLYPRIFTTRAFASNTSSASAYARLFPNVSAIGHQISQALFGGEKLFPALLLPKVFNKLAIANSVNSVSVIKQKIRFRVAFANNVNLTKVRYNRIKKILATQATLVKSVKLVAHFRFVYSPSVNTVYTLRIHSFLRALTSAQIQIGKNLRIANKLRFISTTQISKGSFNKVKSVFINIIKINTLSLSKSVTRSKLIKVTTINSSLFLGSSNPVRKISIMQTNTSYFIKTHNPFRSVKVTTIESITVLRIKTRLEFVIATLISANSNYRKKILIRLPRATNVQLGGETTGFILLTGKALMVGSVSTLRTMKRIRFSSATQINAQILSYVRNRKIKAISFNTSSFSTKKIRRTFSAVQLNGEKIRYIRLYNSTAQQTRIILVPKTMHLVRSAKAILFQESKLLRTRHTNKTVKANQVVSATITKNSSKHVKASIVYEIGSSRRISRVRKAQATTVGIITSSKQFGKVYNVITNVFVIRIQRILKVISIPVQSIITKKQNITQQINVPVITRVTNTQIGIDNNWTTPNNGQPDPGTGPNIFDNNPENYPETQNTGPEQYTDSLEGLPTDFAEPSNQLGEDVVPFIG